MLQSNNFHDIDIEVVLNFNFNTLISQNFSLNLNRYKVQTYEMVFIQQSTFGFVMEYDGKQFMMEKDDILFLPKDNNIGDGYLMSMNKNDKPQSLKTVVIIFNAPQGFFDEAFQVKTSNDNHIRELFYDALKAWQIKSDGYYYKTLSCIYGILSRVVQLENEGYISARQYALISSCVRYIYDHCYESNFDFEQMKSSVSVSYSYVKKLFMKKYGVNPTQFIINTRLNKACDMLSTGSYSITDVSLAVGYDNVSYFSKLFKQKLGCSPKQYQLQHKN